MPHKDQDDKRISMCRVIGCKHDAETTWEPLMHLHGAEVPLCLHHFRRRLLRCRGWIFDGDEEGG